MRMRHLNARKSQNKNYACVQNMYVYILQHALKLFLYSRMRLVHGCIRETFRVYILFIQAGTSEFLIYWSNLSLKRVFHMPENVEILHIDVMLTTNACFYFHVFAGAPHILVIFRTHTCVVYPRLRRNMIRNRHVCSKGVSFISTYSRFKLPHLGRITTTVYCLPRIHVFIRHICVDLRAI
jgi:hypothetical protein